MSTPAAPPTLHLRPPAHRVNPRAKALWTTSAVLISLVPLIGLLVCLVTIAAARLWLAVAFAAVAVVAVAYVAVMPQWRFRVHRWEVTDVSVYAQSGWLSRHRIIIPVNRIQVVDTVAGPLEQLFSLATLTVTTASAHGTVRIVGLDREVARTLSADLARYATEDDDDAT